MSKMLVDVKQYANLIQTISFLLKSYKPRDREAVSQVTEDNESDGNYRLSFKSSVA